MNVEPDGESEMDIAENKEGNPPTGPGTSAAEERGKKKKGKKKRENTMMSVSRRMESHRTGSAYIHTPGKEAGIRTEFAVSAGGWRVTRRNAAPPSGM